MCNLSQGIYDDGIAAGIAKGKAEGIAEGIAAGIAKGKAEGAVSKAVIVVKKLLSKGFSLDEALAVADIDKDTYEKNCRNDNDL